MKIKITGFILFLALFGCSKGGSLVLNGPLTDCPANSTCTYHYYEGADFTGSNQPLHGSYRVFSYISLDKTLCGPNAVLYFKTSLSNNDFSISSSQIPKGLVSAYIEHCPCCEYFAQVIYPKPIGGFIKGKKSGPNQWLINASVILGTSDGHPVDTLTVNQYFTLAKIP